MRQIEIHFKKMSPCGCPVSLVMKSYVEAPFRVNISFWDKDFQIGSIESNLGDIDFIKAMELILDGYFLSVEFEESKRKEGSCK